MDGRTSWKSLLEHREEVIQQSRVLNVAIVLIGTNKVQSPVLPYTIGNSVRMSSSFNPMECANLLFDPLNALNSGGFFGR